MIPERLLSWETDEWTSQVRIKVPKFKSSFGKKICRLFRQAETFNLKLDDFGAAIWLACDGKQTVRAIGATIQQMFGKEVEPLYPRLSKFLNLLEEQGAIRYR